MTSQDLRIAQLSVATAMLSETMAELVRCFEALAIVGGTPDAKAWTHIDKTCDKARALLEGKAQVKPLTRKQALTAKGPTTFR